MRIQIPGRRASRAAVLALSLLLPAAAIIPASAATPDPILGGGLYAQNLLLRYAWSSAGNPPSAMQTAINRGVVDANATRLSQSPSFGYLGSAGNLVYYGTNVPCGVNALACMRRQPPGWFGVWYRENGHRYDWGTLRWCEMTGAPTGCFEAENVALHEFGHVMILDHHVNLPGNSDALDSVMQVVQPAKAAAGWSAHAFARCDVATLQQQYDVASTTTPYSTCLDVPTKIALTVSSTWAPYGSSVTFSATLGSAGSGRLADNAIGSRLVVLQMLGGSGWFDVSTMSAGAGGSYTATRAMWTSASYRALFRKPAGEGLRTSSSGSVTVTVSAACPGGVCPLSASIGGR